MMNHEFRIKRLKLEDGKIIGAAEYYVLNLLMNNDGRMTYGGVWANAKQYFKHINRTLDNIAKKEWVVIDDNGNMILTAEGRAVYSEAKYHFDKLLDEFLEYSGKE